MYEYNYDLMWSFEKITTEGALKLFIQANKNKFDDFFWHLITAAKPFKFSMISEEDLERLDWEYICSSFNLSESDLEKYAYYLNWYCVSAFQKLSSKFIKKYKNELSLDEVVANENLDSDARAVANKLYDKYNDDAHHAIWRDNLKAAPSFRPKPAFKIGISDNIKLYNSIPKEEDINSMQKAEVKKHLDAFKIKYLYKNTIAELRNKLIDYKNSLLKKDKLSDEDYDAYLLERIKRKNPIKEKDPSQQVDYSKYTKAELKAILEKRGIRVFYHDTLGVLRAKCLDSEDDE